MNLAYLTDIILLLLAAVIAVPLTRIIGLGTVPGFLIAGVVVGPSVMGLIDNRAEIAHFAELGVVMLLFVIGIELKPSRLWLMRRMVFGLGALQESRSSQGGRSLWQRIMRSALARAPRS